ncbi:MAG: hypothetical protein ACAI25_12020 [Planctomycetota bacterium]
MLPLACPGISLSDFDLGIGSTMSGVFGALGSGFFAMLVVFPVCVFTVAIVGFTIWHLATPWRGDA